jgi:hypothetical protein
MDTKYIAAVVASMLVIGSGAFYGGMQYEKSSGPRMRDRGQFGDGQFQPGENLRGSGSGGGQQFRGGGFTAGEIISRDDSSITIKMQDGSTKIVLVGSSADVMKTTEGSADDLAVGTHVTVAGTANSDGSMTAQSVQIRPAGAMPFGGPGRPSE